MVGTLWIWDLLLPGSVTAPANGFLTAPLRGQGAFAFNTAGQREDTVNFMINGINLNDMANGQITFQPSINTVQEFKADNSTYSAENGRTRGRLYTSQLAPARTPGTDKVLNFFATKIWTHATFSTAAVRRNRLQTQ